MADGWWQYMYQSFAHTIWFNKDAFVENNFTPFLIGFYHNHWPGISADKKIEFVEDLPMIVCEILVQTVQWFPKEVFTLNLDWKFH